MCRALKVLCAAPDRERLAGLKMAAASVAWELVGGARSAEELGAQVADRAPDVVVVDSALGEPAVSAARAAAGERRLRIVVVGPGDLAGADARAPAASTEDVRAAILGMPAPGGPVRS